MKFLLPLLLISSLSFAQKAKVYFIRDAWSSKGVMQTVNTHLYIDKQKTCTIKSTEFGVMEIEPGEHTFSAGSGKSDLSPSTKVKLEAGKSYYFLYVPIAM